jgi:hypothetical protein
MEAVNDVLKLISTALQYIKAHLADDNIDLDLDEIVLRLEQAVDKLAEIKS